MTMPRNNHRNGFTLLEIIVSLALLAVVAGAMFSALAYGVSAFVFTEDRVEDAQQARLALSRMRRELMEMRGVDASSDQDSLVFTDSDGAQATLAHSGSTVTYNGNTLMNGLGAYGNTEHLFAYAESDGSVWAPATGDFNDLSTITVTLRISSGGTNIDYATTVNPRKTNVPDGPIMLMDE